MKMKTKMKRTRKLLLLLLSLLLALEMPLCAMAATVTGSIFNSNRYTHQDKLSNCAIVDGIDVSYHNGDVDWAKVKKAGVKYVILRVGYRGYGSSGSVLKDSRFDTYIKAAAAQGLDIGVYFYSQALNVTEAKEEASFVLKNIENYKKSITMPVVFDYEFADVSSGRLDSAWRNGTLNKTKMTNNALAFCETVTSAGYTAMVYANKSFLSDNLNHAAIEKTYGIWLAHYTTKTDYSGDYQIWQYTDKGSVNGISGYVDCNFRYVNQSSGRKMVITDISDQVYTGKEIKPSFTVTVDGKELIKGEDYIVSYQNNINIGRAQVVVTGVEDYADVPKVTKYYNIVPQKVAHLQLTERGTTTLSVSWDKLSGATGYRVWIERSNGWNSCGETTGTSYNITGLANASNYRIKVAAYKTVSGVKLYGVDSEPLQTATGPAQVTSLKATARGTNSITLSWKKQSNTSKYIVYRYDAATGKYTSVKEISGGANNSYTVTGLSPNTTYKFRVRAVKKAKEGVTLNGPVSATLTEYTTPNAPTAKTAKSGSTKKITVTWAKLSGISGYQVMWSTTRNFSSNYKSVNAGASKTAATLTTAQSKKQYYVRVRAYKTRNGKKIYSPWSKTLGVKTK